jgi:hypothetical protein
MIELDTTGILSDQSPKFQPPIAGPNTHNIRNVFRSEERRVGKECSMTC